MIDLKGSVRAQREDQWYPTPWGVCAATVDDMMRYVTILERVRPALLIETGTWTGARAKWYSHNGAERVISIDVNDPAPPSGDRVSYVVGSSTDAAVFASVAGQARLAQRLGQAVIVVLDSNHTAGHVRAELELYAGLVTPGSYLVVEDGIIRYCGRNQMGDYSPDDGPLDALDVWLPQHPEFGEDRDIEDLYPTTQHPHGWLRRAPVLPAVAAA